MRCKLGGNLPGYCLVVADNLMKLLTDEVENEITLTAFRLLTLDLLTLYSVMNEGTINVLGRLPFSFPVQQRVLTLRATRTLLRDVPT